MEAIDLAKEIYKVFENGSPIDMCPWGSLTAAHRKQFIASAEHLLTKFDIAPKPYEVCDSLKVHLFDYKEKELFIERWLKRGQPLTPAAINEILKEIDN